MINETFKNNLNSIGVELTDRQYEQFDMYYKLMVEWNSFMNLTGITDYEEVLLKHYVDSLVLDIEKIGHKKKEISLIDVGTGAGFPGLPLKIAHPQLNVVLLDSLNKRVKFLNQVIEELGLTGIETVHSRAEDGGRNNDLREHFDPLLYADDLRKSAPQKECSDRTCLSGGRGCAFAACRAVLFLPVFEQLFVGFPHAYLYG